MTTSKRPDNFNPKNAFDGSDLSTARLKQDYMTMTSKKNDGTRDREEESGRKLCKGVRVAENVQQRRLYQQEFRSLTEIYGWNAELL